MRCALKPRIDSADRQSPGCRVGVAFLTSPMLCVIERPTRNSHYLGIASRRIICGALVRRGLIYERGSVTQEQEA
jgi:hypothetical protein